jgi:hypothetical protein
MPRINQNLRDVKDDDMQGGGGWKALPEGNYRMMVSETEYKSTKNGSGMVLWIRVQCVEPEHSRSKWTEFLTIEHANPETVRIARAKLKSLAIAVGHPDPDFVEYSEDLHNTPFLASVAQEAASDPKYGDVNGMQNRIAAYMPIPGSAPRAARAASDDEPPPLTDAEIPW